MIESISHFVFMVVHAVLFLHPRRYRGRICGRVSGVGQDLHIRGGRSNSFGSQGKEKKAKKEKENHWVEKASKRTKAIQEVSHGEELILNLESI